MPFSPHLIPAKCIESIAPFISVLGSPPATPAAGDRYLVDSGATGDFAGHDNAIAEWDGAAWGFERRSTYPSSQIVYSKQPQEAWFFWHEKQKFERLGEGFLKKSDLLETDFTTVKPFTLITVDEPLFLGGKWEIISNVSFADIATEEIADEKLSLPTILWNSSDAIAQAIAPKVNAVQSQIRLRDGTSSTAVVLEAGTIAGFVWDKKTDGGYELRDISPQLTQEVKANTSALKILTDAAADAPKPAQYEWKRISTANGNIEFALFPGLRFEMKSTDQQLRVRYTGGGTITLTEKTSRHEQSGESFQYDGTFSIGASWKNFTNRNVSFTGAGAIENHYFRYGGRDYKVSGIVGENWKNCIVDMLVSGG